MHTVPYYQASYGYHGGIWLEVQPRNTKILQIKKTNNY